MLKNLVVSVVLGLLLLSSLTLSADTTEKPVMVAMLDVDHQLSISEIDAGEERYIHQVDTQVPVDAQHTVSEMTMFWTMVFGLVFFVIRVTTRPIK